MKLKSWYLFIFFFFCTQLSAMTTQGDRILNSSGQEIELKGVNWFGFNNEQTMVDGLWSESTLGSDFATVAYRLQLLGFNAIRLSFSFKDLYNLSPRNFSEACLIPMPNAIQNSVTNPAVSVPIGAQIPPMVSPPTRIVGECNNYFPNDTTLNRFLWVVKFFAKNGFYVLIDNHLREDQTVLENPVHWLELWKDLVTKISQDSDSKEMLMIDILNEPDNFGIRWENNGSKPGIKELYLSVMDALYPINPKALFFIEGAGQDGIDANWGDGFATDPILIATYGLSDPRPFFNALLTKPYLNQVVISPHVYPPSVTHAPDNFSGAGLYNRLSSSFGYLTQTGYCNGSCKTFPVAIGEFGSRFIENNDMLFLQDFEKYLNNDESGADGKHHTIKHWFYWCWNPFSGDTGGLVEDDWHTVIWKKIDYLATLGLKPWYSNIAPVKTGTLCATILPAAGLSKNNLKPIKIGEQTFEFTDFNLSVCKSLPVGSYLVTPPDITTSTMRFTANPQTVSVTENGTTPVYVAYIGVPIPPPSSDFAVTVQMGTAWQEGGQYQNALNFYVKNNGKTQVNTPWRIVIMNSSYKAVPSYWNVTVNSIVNGQINGTAKEGWQKLYPNGANSVNVGMIISSTSPNFVPTSITINGKPAAITVSQ